MYAPLSLTSCDSKFQVSFFVASLSAFPSIVALILTGIFIKVRITTPLPTTRAVAIVGESFPEASEVAAVSVSNRGENEHTEPELPPGDWEFDDESGLYWSEDHFLFFHPDSNQYFDPASNQWYDPDSNQWYEAEK